MNKGVRPSASFLLISIPCFNKWSTLPISFLAMASNRSLSNRPQPTSNSAYIKMSVGVVFFIMCTLCNISVIYKTVGNRTIDIANNNQEKLSQKQTIFIKNNIYLV